MDLVPVNKLIHEAIEIAVQTQLRCLVKDITATLGVESGPLLKVLKACKNVGYYGDDVDLERRCQELIAVGKYVTPCCEPIMWRKGSTACLQHTVNPSPYKRGRLPVLYTINGMLVDKENGYVYDKEGELIGRFHGDKIVVFEVTGN
jgi:hypothetical protein